MSGIARSRVNFDGDPSCLVCRPHLEEKEGQRIRDGFNGYCNRKVGYTIHGAGFEMWASIVSHVRVDRAVRRARDMGLPYVAVAIFLGDEYVLLTTGPIFDDGGSQLVADQCTFVWDVLMPLWWKGLPTPRGRKRGIRSTQGFLPPAREYRFWEVHHPLTGRRCWHMHGTREEAEVCRDELGISLDGTTKGWRIRGFNGFWSLGRMKVYGDQLRDLLEELRLPVVRVAEWGGRIDGEDSWVVEFGPVEWSDTRFVELRLRAGWIEPPRFVPPPGLRAMRFNFNDGTMTGT